MNISNQITEFFQQKAVIGASFDRMVRSFSKAAYKNTVKYNRKYVPGTKTSIIFNEIITELGGSHTKMVGNW